jgi:hypothetical protein
MKYTPSGASKEEDRTQLKKRLARISSYKDNSVGVCIYLTPSDLELLGISANEVTHIVYQIDQQNGTINLEGISKDETANQR